MTQTLLAAFLSVEGTVLSDAEKRLFERYQPIGVALFNRNIQTVGQLRALTKSLTETVGRGDLLIAVDQEGGRVNRLRAAGFGAYASAQTLGRIDDTALTQTHCRLIARDMQQVGCNFNFAPVADLEYPTTHAVLLGRMFGADPALVIRHARVSVETYQACGICPCMKHIPGHGRTQNDPHLGLPKIVGSAAALERDLEPFRALRQCPSAMTAHIVLPEIDADCPMTLSKKGIREVIRGAIGYDGFLISDALEMQALKGSVAERAKAAWQAGCDAVCYCGGNTAQNESICRAGRRLEGLSLARFERVRQTISAFGSVCAKNAISLEQEEKRYYNTVNEFKSEPVCYDATETLNQMHKGEK